MEKIVVYDLNQTLYKKSSKDEFFKFICYKKGYKLIHLFQIGWMQSLNKLHLISKTFFKENFYDYLNHLPPEKVEKYAQQFWNMEFPDYFREDMVKEISDYHEQGVKVLIITGGFEIYTKYLEKFLPLKVLGTRTKYIDGDYQILGKACNGEEKIKRLEKEASLGFRLLAAFSDDDEAILHKAEKGYLLKEGKLELVKNKKHFPD